MIKDEVEPLGGFIGDAFVQPAFLGLQAATSLFFIILQNFWLGFLAAFMVGIQGVVIPKMRRRLILLGRERQLTARQLAGRVGEIVDGISSIHVHDTSNYERADIASRLGRIFKIRYDLYQWKFFVKFLNNFLAQVTPFLFYAIGGYLALRGELDIGQLIAVISAYKDLPSPIKDLIDWDQDRLNVQVKYEQVYEQFHVDQLIEPSVQALAPESVPPVRLHWQRNCRVIVETVTVVMRFFFTSTLHSSDKLLPSPFACSFAVPARWRTSALPLRMGSSLTEST